MSLRKILSNKVLSATIAATMAISSLIGLGITASAAEESSFKAGTTVVTPQALNATAIDPSDMSTWTVFDTYYRPTSVWPSPGSADLYTSNKPADWDTTINSKGYHPFFYWDDGYWFHDSSTYYDLTDPSQIAAYEKIALSHPGYQSSDPIPGAVLPKSQHIYTKGTANNTEIVFTGYGSGGWVDFALAPVTYDGLKSVQFDIDGTKVIPHTLMSYGIMINAGVNKSTNTFKGYLVRFDVNGSVSLTDYSAGKDANAMHYDANDANLIPAGVSLGSFNRNGKVRVNMDIEPTQVTIKVDELDASGNVVKNALTKTQNITDTKEYGFGPYVNHAWKAEGHTCSRMSFVVYSNISMTQDYSVIFDKNGGDTEANPNRIDEIKKGATLKGSGHGLPTTDPTRAGYVFAGWNMNADGSGAAFDENTPINGITRVYAKWIKDVNITYVPGPNGTLNGSTSETVPGMTGPKNPPTPVPDTNHHFEHWVDQDGNKYAPGDLPNLKLEKDTTFTAVFEVDKAGVNYVADPNGSLDGKDSYPDAPVGGQISKEAPAPVPKPNPGYVFDHWKDKDGKPIDPGTAVVGDNTSQITAVFERDENGDGVPDKDQNKFDVTLKTQGPGKFGASDKTQYQVIERATPPTTLKTDAVGGFKTPQLLPDKSVHPSARFFYWLDETGKEYTTDVDDIPITGNCTLTAFFDTDIDGDGVPDSKQNKHVVTLETKGPGSFGPSDATKYDVLANAGGTTTLGNSAVDGYTSPQLIPNTSAEPSAKFFYWLDESNQKHTTIDNVPITKDCTFTAFFDTDKDGDGQPDSEQDQYLVTFQAKGNGTVSGKLQFDVFKNSTDTQKLKDAIGGFTLPATLPNDSKTAFYRWEDAAGAPIADPSMQTIKSDTIIYAVFSADEDGDGIPDDLQNVFTVTFVTGPQGTMSGTSSYKFIGGTKGDGIPLTITDVVGGVYNVPTINAGSEYTFKGWVSVPGGVIADNPRITSDVVFNADYDVHTYTVKFIVSGKEVPAETRQCAKGTPIGNVNNPTITGGTFEGWIAPDGKLYSSAQVAGLNCTGNMTFTAKVKSSLSVGRR